jgi:hypothetical protein
MRMINSNRQTWEKVEIDQCITFSLTDMGKHENWLIAASYFWSVALNAFLFGNGPMTRTLLDVLMLTGPDISESDKPFYTVIKSSHRLATKEVKCWNGYITEHVRTGAVDHREHTRLS